MRLGNDELCTPPARADAAVLEPSLTPSSTLLVVFPLQLNLEEIETMKQLFKYYDTDTDGHLTRKEGKTAETRVLTLFLGLVDTAAVAHFSWVDGQHQHVSLRRLPTSSLRKVAVS